MVKKPAETPVLEQRISGILLHPSSLPGGHGIGDLGRSSFEFVDFLRSAKQRIWQVLPMGPTTANEFHCPYASVSAFAGNPLLLSLDSLVSDGLLSRSDLRKQLAAVKLSTRAGKVDFRSMERFKVPLLRLAAHNFSGRRADAAIERFTKERHWARGYAQYAALRERFAAPRQRWPLAVRFRPAKLAGALERPLSKDELRPHLALQCLFSRQWAALREYATQKGVYLFGDVPIYVSNDSADVWAHPELFEVDRRTGESLLVSGVPPDIFNSKGQLWGTPLYNWRALRRQKFSWWVERFRELQQSFDIVRVDHFRAFESYWAVPGGAKEASAGKWMKAPGAELFAAIERELGSLPLFVEDLGTISPEVHALRDRLKLMGTRVLQFAFSGDPRGSSKSRHHPVNTPHHTVTYTATHDNAPTAEWFAELPEKNKSKVRGLLNDCRASEVPEQFVRLAMSLPARVCIFPLQDVLGLGRGHRMNYPGTAAWSNWSWRFQEIPEGTAERLAHLSEVYERNR